MRTPDSGVPTTRSVAPTIVVAVATLAIGLGASIGFVWGFIATLLRDDLGLSRAEVGLLVGVYFGSTGVGSIAGGVLTDRVGARLAVAIDLLLVAAAAVTVVAFPAYPVLLGASVVAGAAYSLGNAGTNVAIAAAVPLANRAVALTVKTAGVPMMAVVAALLGPWAGVRFGWTSVIATVAALASVATVAALVVLPPDRPARTGAPAAPRRGHLPAGFWWFPVAAFLLILGSQPLFSWIVPFLDEGLGLSTSAAGRAASLATAVGVVGMITIARRSDRVGPSRRISTVSSWALVAAVGAALAATGTSIGALTAVTGATIGMASQLGAIGVMHAAVVDVAPGAVGRASGVTMTGYYLGALVSPTGFGAVVDATGSYPLAWTLSAASLVAASLAFRRGGARLLPAG